MLSTIIPVDFFARRRTARAYDRVKGDLDQLMRRAAADRHAVVEAAYSDLAMQLCQLLGKNDFADELKTRRDNLLSDAQRASQPLHRRKRRIQQVVAAQAPAPRRAAQPEQPKRGRGRPPKGRNTPPLPTPPVDEDI